MNYPTREKALKLLKKYNKEEFHLRHAFTLEEVLRYLAKKEGEDENFWGLVGLLHDVDYEKWPEEHLKRTPDILKEIDAPQEMIHGILSHGHGICSDVKPEKKMEKYLYAVDELTGLIGACALMRPSKSTKDMELKSLKKKFKDKKFAAGCSRDVIKKGAENLGLELDELLSITLEAMKDREDAIEDHLRKNL